MPRAPQKRSSKPKLPPLSRILAAYESAALADNQFMSALQAWVFAVPGRRAVPDGEWPDNARLVQWAFVFYAEISSGGLLYVVDRDVGNHYTELKGWLRLIGARKGTAYIGALEKLFPKGIVPRTPAARERALSDHQRYDHDGDLSVLDRKYREAVMDEIPQRLFAYVTKHRVAIERESEHAARQLPGQVPDEVLFRESNVLSAMKRVREAALELEKDGKRGDRGPYPKIGDVIEVTASGQVAYVQVTHEHFYHDTRGPVVRVFAKLARRPLAKSAILRMVRGPALSSALFNVRSHLYVLEHDPAMWEGEVAIRTVGNFPLPPNAKRFPRFLFQIGRTRDGRNAWATWTGGPEADERFISPIGDELKALPALMHGPDPDDLIELVRRGMRPLDEHKRWGDV